MKKTSLYTNTFINTQKISYTERKVDRAGTHAALSSARVVPADFNHHQDPFACWGPKTHLNMPQHQEEPHPSSCTAT